MFTFVPNKVYLRGFYCTTLFKTNVQLKHIQFLLRLMVKMLCRIRHAETGFDASKIMIFNLRIKNVLAHRKILNCRKYSMTLAELGKTLQVDVSKVICLNPFIGDDGIIREGGRLSKANKTHDQKYPILLPRSHHVTKLIIRDAPINIITRECKPLCV